MSDFWETRTFVSRYYRGKPEQTDPACSDSPWGQRDHHQHGSPGRSHHHRCKPTSMQRACLLLCFSLLLYFVIVQPAADSDHHFVCVVYTLPRLISISPPSAEERSWTGRSAWASRPISCPAGHRWWRTSWRCVCWISTVDTKCSSFNLLLFTNMYPNMYLTSTHC